MKNKPIKKAYNKDTAYKSNDFLYPYKTVRATQTGDTARISTATGGGRYNRWRKLTPQALQILEQSGKNPSGYRAKYDERGQVVAFKRFIFSSSAKMHTDNIRRTIARIRDTINTNCTDENKERLRFITLTYAENMTDTKKLAKDLEQFCKALHAKHTPKWYISIVEPQERGAWHAHIIAEFYAKTYIHNDTLARELWRNRGFTKTERLKKIDNIGNYLASYLSNLDGKKGQRLHYYPPKMRIMRCSQSVKRPTKTTLPADAARELLQNKGYKHQDGRTLEIKRNDGQLVDITHEYYKKGAQANAKTNNKKNHIFGGA
jgi:hypothetical protein